MPRTSRSIRVSHAAYNALSALAASEQRTRTAVVDRLVGVGRAIEAARQLPSPDELEARVNALAHVVKELP